MKLLAMAVFFTSLSSYAHREFVGNIKGTTKACRLEIEQTYFENNTETPENLRADIVLSLEDDHHHKAVTHGEEFFFTIKPSANALIFSGVGANQKDQVNVITAKGDLNEIHSYAVKWLHTNHFHSAQCVNLKYVQH